MDRLHRHARGLLAREEATVLLGDYNIIPAAIDAAVPEAWVNDALFLPQSRSRFHALINLGFTEAVRAMTAKPGIYTFWDYQAGAWQKNNGIRIDHACSLRRPPTGWSRPGSIYMSAAGKSPLTMFRSS